VGLFSDATIIADFAAGWGAVLVLDFMVFGMTVAKSIKIGKSGNRTLINVLVRDGRFVTLHVNVPAKRLCGFGFEC
jgi:hypothetical protein